MENRKSGGAAASPEKQTKEQLLAGLTEIAGSLAEKMKEAVATESSIAVCATQVHGMQRVVKTLMDSGVSERKVEDAFSRGQSKVLGESFVADITQDETDAHKKWQKTIDLLFGELQAAIRAARPVLRPTAEDLQ